MPRKKRPVQASAVAVVSSCAETAKKGPESEEFVTVSKFRPRGCLSLAVNISGLCIRLLV